MSKQSIELNRPIDQIKDCLLNSFEQYFYNKNFRIGETANMEEMTYNRRIKNILCSDDCEVVNYMQDKLDGKLCAENKPKRRKLCEYLECCESQGDIDLDKELKVYWTRNTW